MDHNTLQFATDVERVSEPRALRPLLCVECDGKMVAVFSEPVKTIEALCLNSRCSRYGEHYTLPSIEVNQEAHD